MNAASIDTLVTGATGFIGRWLLIALTSRGRRVAAVVRRADERREELKAFVDARGGDARRLMVIEGDVTQEDLGLAVALPGVRDVYHLAARMAFGLQHQEARETNVEGTVHALRWAAKAPALRRFVELGGYRMTHPPARLRYPLTEAMRHDLYRKHGAYEASKHEAHVTLHALAVETGVPLTSVHPCGVIGDSRTGECTQTDGLGEMAEALWLGKLRALAGSDRTFVPLVAVDYLADFLATVVEREETLGASLVVLDDATPNLPELVAAMGRHLDVRAPRLVLPLALVRWLPMALTGLHPEAIGFLSEDRYDVADAAAHAEAMELEMPPWDRVLTRWLDHLVATRFLREPSVRTSPHGLDLRMRSELASGRYPRAGCCAAAATSESSG